MQKKLFKQLVKAYNAIVEALNSFSYENVNLTETGEEVDFDRPPSLPCIRILPNGSTEMYNCKTGEAIP